MFSLGAARPRGMCSGLSQYAPVPAEYLHSGRKRIPRRPPPSNPSLSMDRISVLLAMTDAQPKTSSNPVHHLQHDHQLRPSWGSHRHKYHLHAAGHTTAPNQSDTTPPILTAACCVPVCRFINNSISFVCTSRRTSTATDTAQHSCYLTPYIKCGLPCHFASTNMLL